MSSILARAALAAALGIGSVGGLSAPATAQNLELEIGPDGVRPIIRDDDRYERRDRYRDRDRYGDRRDRRAEAGCSQRQALRIARSEGLRNAEVIRTTRRSITVEGDTRRGPDRMRFANVAGCPEI